MRKFLKDNLVLAVGISMPIVVVLLFLLASNLPREFVEPPAYDFLFTTTHYSGSVAATVNFDIREGRLRARIFEAAHNRSGSVPKLFLYDHERQTVRPVTVDLPEDLEHIKDGTEIRIAEAAHWRIDASRKAPDGYEIRDRYRRGVGLLGGLFYSGRGSGQAIVKDGAVYRIPDTDASPYGYITFLGWVVGEDE